MGVDLCHQQPQKGWVGKIDAVPRNKVKRRVFLFANPPFSPYTGSSVPKIYCYQYKTYPRLGKSYVAILPWEVSR